MKNKVITEELIENKIYLIRGEKVMLSHNLAQLYNVEVRNLIQAVKRNRERFPNDFMFQLSKEETRRSRSQNVILKRGHNIKYLPYAFTEQGVAMLSSVLRSKQAVQVNIGIMRAFVKLRRLLLAHKKLPGKLNELERRIENCDKKIHNVFEAIRQLMKEEVKPKTQIGFHAR